MISQYSGGSRLARRVLHKSFRGPRGTTAGDLDHEVNMHCNAERLKAGKRDARKLVGEVRSAGDRGQGVLAYFYQPGYYDIKKCEPKKLMTYRFARKRVEKKDYESTISKIFDLNPNSETYLWL